MSLTGRVAYGCGVFLIILGIVIAISWPRIYDSILKEKLALSPSSDSYKLWVRTPVPMYLDVYLFNWTNSEEFLRNKRVKPIFEEIGPFVFKEVHQRVDLAWNSNDSVSYNQTRSWSFIPQESLDLSTPIFNLNVIATTITKMASGDGIITKVVLDFLNMIYKEKLLIMRPAREWLFDGIEDKLLDLVRRFVEIPYAKFGWFYGRNLSSAYDGKFNINTGADNIFNLGAMQQWNDLEQTHFYEGECGAVRGSSGELFSPLKESQDNLSIFVTDFCGPITLKYSGQKLVEGLNGYHFVGDKSVFDDGSSYPSNKCFCTGECVPSGVRNVTSCRQAPLFISFPHFYLSDPSYTKAVVGMKPNKSIHEFYLDIDPLTGIPLEVRAQLQLNVLLQPLKTFPMFVDVPRVFVPMIWFRQRAKVTSELASRGKLLRMLEKMGLGLSTTLVLLGLIIIIIRFSFVTYLSKRKHSELLITSEDDKEEEPKISDNEISER